MILHSKINQNVLKSPQITPEAPKSMHLGHIFWLGLAKTVFLHCLPHQTVGAPPYFKWPFGRCFSFQKWNITYQWSQIGKIDPKDYRRKETYRGNGTKHVLHVSYRLVKKNRPCALLVPTLWIMVSGTILPTAAPWRSSWQSETIPSIWALEPVISVSSPTFLTPPGSPLCQP